MLPFSGVYTSRIHCVATERKIIVSSSIIALSPYCCRYSCSLNSSSVKNNSRFLRCRIPLHFPQRARARRSEGDIIIVLLRVRKSTQLSCQQNAQIQEAVCFTIGQSPPNANWAGLPSQKVAISSFLQAFKSVRALRSSVSLSPEQSIGFRH